MPHYRRHFMLYEGETDVVNFDSMGNDYLEKIDYSEENLYELIGDCDFSVYIRKFNNVYKHYLENHRKENLEMIA